MSITIDIRDLPARLEEALALASAGGEVLFIDGAVPRARLMPPENPPLRTPGLHSGVAVVAPDFDAPLPDGFWTGLGGFNL